MASEPLKTHQEDGSIILVLPEPVQCGGCGNMAVIVINRDGKTRCATCDGKYVWGELFADTWKIYGLPEKK